MKYTKLLLPLCLFTSCGCRYTDEDFAFSNVYATLLQAYHPGDTLFFSSRIGGWDTITVASLDTFQTCGGFMVNNHRSVAVAIRHLPHNRSHGGIELNPEPTPPTRRNQELIAVEKTLTSKGESYFVEIDYQNFIGILDPTAKPVSDSLFADYGISQYWSLSNEVLNKQDSIGIDRIFWTEKWGLTGYTHKNGEMYTLQRKR